MAAETENKDYEYALEFIESRLGEIALKVADLESRGNPQPETEYFRIEAVAVNTFIQNLFTHVVLRRDEEWAKGVQAAVDAFRTGS